jgi:prophage regulatory protein
MPKLLTFDELRDHGVPYVRHHLDRLERAGKFPKRVAIGSHRVGWIETEVDAWFETKIAARSQTAGALGSEGKIKRRGSRPPRPASQCS